MRRLLVVAGLVLLLAAPAAAADQADEAATYYQRGLKAGAKDPQAVALFTRAAGLGHARAQVALAGRYLSGDGVQRDLTQAIRWYGRAAEQGDAEAFYKLGAIYHRGGATVKAYACYRLAAALGAGEARARAKGGLSRMAVRLTSAQRQQAEELAAGWRITIDR